jgi:hypothetical protein
MRLVHCVEVHGNAADDKWMEVLSRNVVDKEAGRYNGYLVFGAKIDRQDGQTNTGRRLPICCDRIRGMDGTRKSSIQLEKKVEVYARLVGAIYWYEKLK